MCSGAYGSVVGLKAHGPGQSTSGVDKPPKVKQQKPVTPERVAMPEAASMLHYAILRSKTTVPRANTNAVARRM